MHVIRGKKKHYVLLLYTLLAKQFKNLVLEPFGYYFLYTSLLLYSVGFLGIYSDSLIKLEETHTAAQMITCQDVSSLNICI